ncbi:Egg cell-secreted protein 1.2 [Morella rubra]|uniref:Egg cell-secreted protein 1.2 n=1 Tax=Morella rubra TaxID=262757 RepID=A0A6A1VGY9_9ROSI|nr:Egg cell-secreted protein 1.2 [Morella rubra]
MAVKKIVIFLLLSCLLANATARRDLAIESGDDDVPSGCDTFGALVDCWVAVMGLNYCSTEILLVAVKAQDNLSPDCCHVISTVTNKCWPYSMLTSLGFAANESSLLQGYCGAVSQYA